jgi:sugar phosphate isomerase/epimerase
MSLVAIALPTRRPFDSTDQLDERMRRADAAFAMAYDLGTTTVLARAGTIPPAEDAERLEIFTNNLLELGRRAEHHGVKLALETGADPGEKLRSFLDKLASPGLAASIDPGSILQAGIDPINTVRELAARVVHAYAKDATGSAGVPAINPRGFGFPPGALDWEEYLGALEEIGYRGFLTVWPAPGRPAGAQFTAVADRLKRLH